MRTERKSVLLRCFTSLLTGILVSFLMVSAFAEMIVVTGDKKTFTVGGTNYSNYAELTYLDNTDMSGHLEIRNLSGNSNPAGCLGAQPMIYKRQNPNMTYELAQSSDWVYSRTASRIFIVSKTVQSLSKRYYYVTTGETAVYSNGNYVTQSVITSPTIFAD